MTSWTAASGADADPRPPAILLMGPTAAGKTALAVELARRLPCEIVSVDSAMIYRGLDIGTAKPGPELLALAPHRLIDILDPSETYSTARFRADALAAMADIVARGRIPLLTGGTMLYFRALQRGLASLPGAAPELRAELLRDGARLGWAALHARLATLDPDTAARIHPNDPQRIQRALEVCLLTGQPLSALLRAAEHTALPYRAIKLARAPASRAILHARIDARFRAMLADGLLDEVAALWARGDLTRDLPALRCVGYRQALDHLLGECDRATLLERGIAASRQLARRQLTWLRAESDCRWLDDTPDPLPAALRIVATALAERR